MLPCPPPRVMATCSTLGQAVGTASAYCINENISPRQLAVTEKHITRLQQILLRQDQSMLGVLNNDPDDLARKAIVKASSQTDIGSAELVLDGINRDIDDGKCHQWQAEISPGNPWIELGWNKPVTLNQIHLTFDTGARRQLRLTGEDSVYNMQIRGPQPECVSDFKIEAGISGAYQEIEACKGNYLRHVVLNFDEISTDAH